MKGRKGIKKERNGRRWEARGGKDRDMEERKVKAEKGKGKKGIRKEKRARKRMAKEGKVKRR